MDTLLLNPTNPQDLKTAAQLIRDGGLVAIPTETVYGLGANALDPVAVGGIFAAKGRPQDNPLIVHISDLDQIDALTADFTPIGRQLAEAFWPGPLTIILKKSGNIPQAVSAGLDTVGIRMPSHPAALALITQAGVPVAAPSANTSGRPSPTTAAHVLEDMQGKIAAVLEGGSCDIGLESTVVDATGQQAVILRPGAITPQMLAAVLGESKVGHHNAAPNAGEAPRAPGMKYRHYAPKAAVTLVCGSPQESYRYIAAHAQQTDGILAFSEYFGQFPPHYTIDFGKSYDKKAHGKILFDALRHFDTLTVGRIFIQCPREYGAGIATVNRLKKAAEGNIVPASARKIVGITGLSGSGKTHISRSIAKNHLLIDADAFYGDMLLHHGPMLAELEQAFPAAFSGGVLDKKQLSQLVFADKAQLERLNAITHPYIIAALEDFLQNHPQEDIYIDAPTLFESGFDRYCTCIIGVIASRKTCLRRIMERDKLGEEQAAARLDKQKDPSFFLEHCDKIIENE